ncbi:MAG: polysaccharide pyruvyl transferase family protein [Pseudomonadota bacterium]
MNAAYEKISSLLPSEHAVSQSLDENSQYESFAGAMADLKTALSAILGLIPRGAPVAYIDYPVHQNVGDLLIMLGTEQFFLDHGLSIVYRASIKDFHALPAKWRRPETVILCHGGGNLGDIYPPHQALRERLIAKYPGNRIIILPQTIHFADPKRLAESAQSMQRHPDLHIFTRDEISYRLARNSGLSKNVYLSPDMAHQLWPRYAVENAPASPGKTLFLIRTDLEKSPVPSALTDEQASFVDWSNLLKPIDPAIIKFFTLSLRLNGYLGNCLPLRRLWFSYANMLVRRAIKLYQPHEKVCTSRLHGHILACLMAKPSRLLDNSYGKNSAYFRAWTQRISACKLESTK